MKSLVTGGTGFVGSHVIETLVAQGDSVRALVRPSGDRAFLTQLGAEPALGDLDDFESLRAACRGVDVVYHSAARVEIVGDYEDFHRTTVLGTTRLIQAAAEMGVRRFVYVSSCGVFHPKLLGNGPLNERTPTPEPPKWFVYARSKLAAERAVRELVRPPMEWVIVRLAYLYGPRNRAFHRYLRPHVRRGVFMLLGDGSNEMAMLYVGDAARAVAAAGQCAEAAGQTLIAAGNEHVTQKDYMYALADGFGVRRPRFRVPYGFAFYWSWGAEQVLRYTQSTARLALNRTAVVLTGLPQRIDGTWSQQILGWRPEVSFVEGMRRAFDWYYEEHPEERARGPAISGAQALAGR